MEELERVESEWVSSPSPILCARFSDLLRQSGRYPEAFKIAEEGLKKWKNNTSIAVVLGKCYLDSGLLEKAMEVFDIVHSMQPQNLVVLRSLAEIHYRKENWSKAIDFFEEYLFENPGDDEARDLQEKARSMQGAQYSGISSKPEEPVDITDDSSVLEDDDEDQDIFPDTDRMKKILESQGIDLNSESGGSQEDQGYPIEKDSMYDRAAPGSLLEFFTDEEKAELQLDEYDGED
jgi:tetratricopeptide (TPR) repeat protein